MGHKHEHYAKYEALARRFQHYDLPSYVPATVERIALALNAGDEHLNTIPLGTWDKAASAHFRTMVSAGMRAFGPKTKCPTCGEHTLRVEPEVRELWKAFKHEDGRGYYSLAERVCLLKHVACYWLVGVEPPQENE